MTDVVGTEGIEIDAAARSLLGLPLEDLAFSAHVGHLGVDRLPDRGILHDESRRVPADHRRHVALAVTDACVLLLAWTVAALVTGGGAGETAGLPSLLLAAPAWVLLHKVFGLYDRDTLRIEKSSLDELPRIGQVAAAALAVLGVAVPASFTGLSHAGLLVLWLVAVVSEPAARALARTAVRVRMPRERCVIVGSGVVAGMVARKLADHAEYGIDVAGFVDAGTSPRFGRRPRLGSIEAFEDICERVAPDRVIIAFSDAQHGPLIDVIRISTRRQMKVSIVPRLFEVVGHGVETDRIEGLALLSLRPAARSRLALAAKRAVDVAGAAAGLVVASPLLAAIALAVRMDSPGSVLFAQPRVGRGNDTFRMLKFRTMVPGADAMKSELAHLNELVEQGPMFKIADDPRITRLGRLLRKTSLDELPQLVNVLRGEMSLVGPRPLVPDESAHVVGWHRARLDLTPGLTGPWQVMGRTAIPFSEMVKLDYLYVADWSLWNDVKLLLRTLPVVVRRSGR